MRRATAHLTHGYLGAGKTAFALRFEQESGAVRFTHDEWMRKLYGDDPPAEAFAALADRVSGLIETLWIRLLQARVDVILDFGFWSRAERDRVRAKIDALGAECRLYRFACSDLVALERIGRRNATCEHSLHVTAETFAALKSRFQPLDDDEDRIEASQGRPGVSVATDML